MNQTFNSSAHVERNDAGCSTCSRTSIEHTTSNRFGSGSKASAGKFKYVSRGGSEACFNHGSLEA